MRQYIAHHYKIILTASFAMFSMFFGAGNLVFPLSLGVESVQDNIFASLGLFATAIIVPFLGVIAVALYEGNRAAFFGAIGRKSSLFLTIVILALMGPFGGIPRCVNVAFGGISMIAPGLSPELFNALFCCANLLIIWNHERIVPIIGAFLSPWLICSIIVLIIAGLCHTVQAPSITEPLTNMQAFSSGLLKGYHTMDLLAAFFFSATSVHYLRDHLKKKEAPAQLLPLSIITTIFAAIILGLTYVGFIHLGAHYSAILQDVAPQEMLVTVAGEALGPIAIPVVAVTILLACLTTVSILVTLVADFCNEDMTKGKLGHHPSIIGVLGLSYIVSLIGFVGLSTILGYILNVAYPALIALVFGSILEKLLNKRLGRPFFWLTFLCSALFQLWTELPAIEEAIVSWM